MTYDVNRVRAEFEIIDLLPMWQLELIWEYGSERTMQAVREHPTPKRARAFLEADRLAREIARWAN